MRKLNVIKCYKYHAEVRMAYKTNLIRGIYAEHAFFKQ